MPVVGLFLRVAPQAQPCCLHSHSLRPKCAKSTKYGLPIWRAQYCSAVGTLKRSKTSWQVWIPSACRRAKYFWTPAYVAVVSPCKRYLFDADAHSTIRCGRLEANATRGLGAFTRLLGNGTSSVGQGCHTQNIIPWMSCRVTRHGINQSDPEDESDESDDDNDDDGYEDIWDHMWAPNASAFFFQSLQFQLLVGGWSLDPGVSGLQNFPSKAPWV